MEVLSGVQLRDHAAYVDGTLIIADLHIGKAAAADVAVPIGAGEDMVERVRSLCTHFDPETVVVAGDLLHSFETVPHLVRETLDGITGAVGDRSIVVTPGNHDTLLEAVWTGETTPEYRVGETLICHGHVEPAGDASRYIIGHDHPTITIEGYRRPCYLAGDGVFAGADLLVLPSFNRLVAGVEVNQMTTSEFLSPLITDADALSPVIRDENRNETLEFPALGEFRQTL